MTEQNRSGGNTANREVSKPFLTGSVFDERSAGSCFGFFGVLILVFIIVFIACVSATFESFILRLIFNAAVIILTLFIFYNKGVRKGTDDVARGEILWQRKEKGQPFTKSEQSLSFHPMKGYVTGLVGSTLFFLLALYLAINTSVRMTGSGGLPSWMQAYVKRSDIGDALVNYTNPEGMAAVDYVRAIVRITILPFVNIVGSANRNGLLVLERLSPLILLLPSAAYGTGYLSGRSMRTKIHTAISENDRKRKKKEQKRRKLKAAAGHNREPEQLN